MQLQAASIGEAVPRENFKAIIQSVFDTAANLRLIEEERLITLLLSDRYEVPQGIRIPTRNASLPSMTVGQRAASRDGILHIDGSPFTVNLRHAQIWKCCVPELDLNMGYPSLQKAWATAWELLNKGQRTRKTDMIAEDLYLSNSGSPFSHRMSESVMKLMSSAERSDVQVSIQAAENLIGLGPGVTPTGDDFLVGFLAGLWSTRGKDQGHFYFIHSFGDALMQIAKGTNEISRTYLYHATLGQFSSSLSNLLEAIGTGVGVELATEEGMQVGHSSGMDSVTGLLIGLTVWSDGAIPLNTIHQKPGSLDSLS